MWKSEHYLFKIKRIKYKSTNFSADASGTGGVGSSRDEPLQDESLFDKTSIHTSVCNILDIPFSRLQERKWHGVSIEDNLIYYPTGTAKKLFKVLGKSVDD